jgi:very-short-patch-repair endonuclease
VSLHWNAAPPLHEELNEIVAAMAAAAKDLWPHWYCSVEERFNRERWPNAEVELRLEDARGIAPTVSAAWFRKAWNACRAGGTPVVRHVSAAEQLRQLALALDPKGPLMLLLVSDPTAPPTRIHALARAAEWLASHASVAVILVIPESWLGKPELDVVGYEPIVWEASDSSESDELPLPEIGPRILVEPTIGLPHPASRAEQRLYDFLVQDPSLAKLFRFNQRVFAFQDQPFRVDLLCQEHRIVVEVDGNDHRSFRKYREDRDRDYRLLAAGYWTLRLTNEDVFSDIALVLAKLHNLIDLRTRQKTGKHELST